MGSSIKLRPEKRYSRLAIGCNVWGVGIVLAGLLLCFLKGSLIKLKLLKKKVQLSGHRLEINTESEYDNNLQVGMALSIK